MKRNIITLTMLFLSFLSIVHAQNTFLQPMDIGSKASSFTFSDTKNTANYTNDYNGQATNDVFYKFTLTRTMDVVITHCGSELFDTYVHLLNASGNLIDENDDDYEYMLCENPYNSALYMTSLAPGTYYVVSEGYGDNGNITTNIQGIRPANVTSQYGGLDPSTEQNFITSIVPTVASTDASTLSTLQSIQTIQYFDDLGRPTQTVQRNITPEKEDLVDFTEYDGYGRDYKSWLPTIVTDNQGAYVNATAFVPLANNQYGSSEKPYSTTEYETSPLNRVTGKYGAGANWYTNQKKVIPDYLTNTASDVVRFFINSNNVLERNGYYTASDLYVSKNADEDGKLSYSISDKQGRVILKRQYNNGNIDTYYVYDEFEHLRYVLPPLASAGLTSNTTYTDDNSVLKKYAYLYKYNKWGNNVQKRLPGCDSIRMVYDKADRLILSQDGNQRQKKLLDKKQWSVTKYDLFGRVIFSGIVYIDSTKNSGSLNNDYRDLLVTESYTDGSGYNNVYFSDATALTVNYYDSSNFIGLLPNSNDRTNLIYDISKENDGYGKRYDNTKGLLTGSRTYILDKTISSFTTTALYYDDKGQVIQTRSSNHLGGYDYEYKSYDFTGKVLKSKKEHNIASTPTFVPEVYTYTYDHAGRLKTTTYQLNNQTPVVLSNLSYDKLGRLAQNLRHNSTDTVSYKYNIRNWPTELKSGAFKEKLYYDNTDLTSAITPCYNGNIAASTWTYNSNRYAYKYTYDQLNRLTYGIGYKVVNNTFTTPSNHETYIFDQQGNITNLNRYTTNPSTGNLIGMDYLSMTYDGNQIKSISDAYGSQNQAAIKEYNNRNTTGNDFYYDNNGNMIADLDRKIVAIRYNILNLPDTIQFANGNQIINRYDASGRKLRTDYFTMITPTNVPLNNTRQWDYNWDYATQNGTAYIDNFEYYTEQLEGDPWFVDLDKIYNSEGYVHPASPVNWFYYFRKDHLGDNREVWYANTNTTVQRTQYYPSGLPWASNTGDNPSLQSRKYNGKEFVEMHGYDTYDIVWRQYYPAIGRFQTPDPEVENDYDLSPYTMCDGNMVLNVDPDGRQAEIAAYEQYSAYSLAMYRTGRPPSIPNYSKTIQNVKTAVILYTKVAVATALAPVVRLKNTSQQQTNNNQAKAKPKANNVKTSAADYSNVPDPKNAGDGKKTTRSQRKKLLEENKKQNNGELRSDGDGRKLDPPTKNIKGQKANMNQAEVDHINPRSKGGSNKNNNVRVISKEENLAKGNR